jgi:TetR/AcrR family transcriptional regulator, transcriptional repressor for nem operon
MPIKQPDLTREKLLMAAYHEIHRQGFQAASIAGILDAARLTKGALYHHFPTKHALGLAVVDEVIHEKLAEMVFVPLQTSEQPVETLLSIIATRVQQRPQNFIELGCPLNNLMQEMSPLDEEFKLHLNAVLSAWKEAVENALVRGQQQGDIRLTVDCNAAALFVVSAWEGCIGIAKNIQSSDAFGLCMQELHCYVQGLRTSPRT